MAVNPDELNNILITVKKGILIPDTTTVFDSILINHINSVMSNLSMLGVGPSVGFSLSEDHDETWDDFLGATDLVYFALVKSYVIASVKMLFDPSASSVIMTATKELLQSYEAKLAQLAELQTV